MNRHGFPSSRGRYASTLSSRSRNESRTNNVETVCVSASRIVDCSKLRSPPPPPESAVFQLAVFSRECFAINSELVQQIFHVCRRTSRVDLASQSPFPFYFDPNRSLFVISYAILQHIPCTAVGSSIAMVHAFPYPFPVALILSSSSFSFVPF